MEEKQVMAGTVQQEWAEAQEFLRFLSHQIIKSKPGSEIKKEKLRIIQKNEN